jgi:hypothetical protein
MMQVRLVIGEAGRPILAAKSTTGTTLPRRFITPRMQAVVPGTRVTLSYSMISFTRRIPTPYSSPQMRKVRYCPGSAIGWSLMAVS